MAASERASSQDSTVAPTDASSGRCVSQVIIPVRLGSTRLPYKPLLRQTGKTLIQHTYEAAQLARRPAGVCVATDSREIFDAVVSFGGRVVMTSKEARSGTDRAAEAALGMPDASIIVNMQCDEPELSGKSIDLAKWCNGLTSGRRAMTK
jgi:3-deoxy-manno-octulosonate cytidylyltransferase (CMP-KDO synthetase)